MGYVFATGRRQNASGNYDMWHMKFDTTPIQTGTKAREWEIAFPQSGGGNGHDVPAAMHWDTSIWDEVEQDYLPSLFIGGSSVGGVSATTGEDWRVIRYVETP